ncbi:unnamed protein product [Clonostachys solani]|uniref:Uncharacterized protein n=1 Tax=Clonostachys solani TaxID=160281 RepID=A0A9N9W7P9_9HYPO|nr:unnamed protein product [Clonostachys solani]
MTRPDAQGGDVTTGESGPTFQAGNLDNIRSLLTPEMKFFLKIEGRSWAKIIAHHSEPAHPLHCGSASTWWAGRIGPG